jgi:DNA (cytosine-5)-methyltransferase 1
MKVRKIQAIDLFCGIGGLTAGIKAAGIEVKAGLDNDKTCQYAYESNNEARFINADISDYKFSDLDKYFTEGATKVLVGCAPCQPFSSHTFKIKNKKNDKRWTLIDYYVKAVKELRPDVISMENVRGITKTEIFRDFVTNLGELGYTIDYKVVYCPDYGVPQSRSRMILLGSRLGEIKVPEPTLTSENYITVEQAIKGLPKIAAGEQNEQDKVHRSMKMKELNRERIIASKPGGTWHDWDNRLLPECYKKISGGTYTAVYGRMKWDAVAPTITTQFYNYGSGRFGHPEQNRALSIREGALLQTFPKDYDFGPNITLGTIGRQIGNAVPPKLGEVIGKTIREHIEFYESGGKINV